MQKLITGRWIAGTDIDAALIRAEHLNASGINAVINYLGEEFTEASEVRDSVKTYALLIKLIAKRRLDAGISIKPTQLGLVLDKKLFMKNYSYLVRLAHAHKVFVWLDMEAYIHVDATLDAYQKHAKGGNTGVCIQSYLKRSIDDVKRIVRFGGMIRLVKGAYSVDAYASYTSRAGITKNYDKIMRYLFLHSKRFVVATHDTNLVREALALNKKYKRGVIFAMLNGIADNYAKTLALSGQKVSLYVPFGSRWLSYSYRRFKEFGNLTLVLRSLFAK